VTISSRPSVGQDGEGYTSDLGIRKIRIFLQKGLDRFLLICPSGGRCAGDNILKCCERAKVTTQHRLLPIASSLTYYSHGKGDIGKIFNRRAARCQ
jgi:hypothetical protein